MQVKAGLAGLVALVWATAAILIWTTGWPPAPAQACVSQHSPGGDARFVLVDADGKPIPAPDGVVTSCNP